MKTLLIMFGLAGLASCTTKVLTPADFDRLPRGVGWNLGSIQVEPWEYAASDARWHHFRYSWFTGQNWARTRSVKIRRGLVTVPFERPVGGYYKTVWMEPVLRDGRIVAFKTKTGRIVRPIVPH